MFLCRTLYCAKGNYEFGISRVIKIYIYMLRVCCCAGLFTAPRVTMSSASRASSRYIYIYTAVYVTCLFLCRTLYCAKGNYEFGISRVIKIYIYMLRVCCCAGLSTAPRVTMSSASRASSRYTYIYVTFCCCAGLSTAQRVTMYIYIYIHIYVTCLFLCRTLYCAKGNYEFGISRVIKNYIHPVYTRIYMLRVCCCAGLFTAPRVTMSLASRASSRYTYICYVFVVVQDSLLRQG